MAYATVAQVASEFKSITFSSTTLVTDTEVTRFIAEADAEINAYIGSKYETPIDETEHPNSFILVRQISIWLVADRVREVMQMKNLTPEEIEQGVRPPSSRKAALDLLKKIQKGEINLSDADLVNTDAGVKSFAVDNNLEHTFKRNVDQW